MTPESRLAAEIRLACSHGPIRLFRQNTGLAWTGTVIQRSASTITLQDYRPFKSGFTGLADFTGWVTRDEVAVFAALEVKSARGRVTDEQGAFIAAVQRAGGVAGVARSVEEATALLR